MRKLLVLACAAAVALAASGLAPAGAPPRPSAHDRALARQLADKVAGFKALAKQTDVGKQLDATLKTCPELRKNPGAAFGAAIALLPALLIELVNEAGPQLRDLRSTIGGMHPDSPVFASWLKATGQSLDLLLGFDNHGKKIDYCRAAHVMLEKNPSRAEIQDVLGVDPALVAKLFTGGTSKASATLQKLKPRMRAFFRAAGLPAATASTLTS